MTATTSTSVLVPVMIGGTGRFDGAGGVMTGHGALEMGDDSLLLQSGTFHLRADLWDETSSPNRTEPAPTSPWTD